MLVTPQMPRLKRGGKRVDASKERNFIKTIECFLARSATKICVFPLWRSPQELHKPEASPGPFLKAGFPIFVSIKQALVGVFAYICQAGKTLKLSCHGNPDNLKFD